MTGIVLRFTYLGLHTQNDSAGKPLLIRRVFKITTPLHRGTYTGGVPAVRLNENCES